MCTFNGGLYLRQQLDSIIQQTYTNLEIVIVDDGSTDDTIAIIVEYLQKDGRIRFYQNEKNLGYNKNFEKAFQLCTAEYIAISDQDDIWGLNKIEAIMNARTSDSVFIYSLSRDFWGDTPERGEENKPIRYYEGSMPAKLAFDSPIHGHACMFHSSLLKKAMPFPPDVYYDWWLSMVASATGKVSCIKQTFTYHRISGQNSSRVLLDIKEKKEKTEKLRRLCITHTETFLNRSLADTPTRVLLERYVHLLKQKKNNRFSWPLFILFFRNRSITFHYKRKRNIFSLLKNSFKRAFTGL
jgi:glycosyltransferase involved in cell wall biosynthesis